MKRFFESFRGKREQVLVSKFEVNEELETTLAEYVRVRIRTVQIGMSIGIPIMEEQKRVAMEALEDNQEYQKARQRLNEIKSQYDERLLIYLRPYIELGNIHAPSSTSGEYNRWYVARVLDAEKT